MVLAHLLFKLILKLLELIFLHDGLYFMCRKKSEKRIISESYDYRMNIFILSYFFYDLTSDEHLNQRIKTP